MSQATPYRPPARAFHWPVAVVLAACIIASGCKPARKAEAPGGVPVSDDIAEIEARLSSNRDALQAEGIHVAARSMTPTAGAERTKAAEDAAGADESAPSVTREEDADEEETVEDEAPVMAEPQPEYEPAAPADEPSPGAARQRASRRSFWDRWLDRRRARKAEAERCQRICDLAEATCGLSDRICDLATRHPDAVRYEDACATAEAQCDAASEACTACAD